MPDTVGQRTGHEQLRKPSRSADWAIIPDCHMGIEIELEEVNNYPDVESSTLWSLTSDGSLRGRHSVEYVLSRPMASYSLDKALKYLPTKIKGFEPSERTSLHLHINVRDLTIAQLNSFIMIYLMIEPLLFNQLPKERKESIFCLPLHKTVPTCRAIANSIRARLNGRNVGRNSALNFNAVQKFGTLELRVFQATIDPEEIILYIRLLQQLKLLATELDQDSRQELLDMVCRDGLSWVNHMFPEDVASYLLGNNSDLCMLIRGTRAAQSYNLMRITASPNSRRNNQRVPTPPPAVPSRERSISYWQQRGTTTNIQIEELLAEARSQRQQESS